MKDSRSRTTLSVATANKARPRSSGQTEARRPEIDSPAPIPRPAAPDHPAPSHPLGGIGRTRADVRRIFMLSLKGQMLYSGAEPAQSGPPEPLGAHDLKPHLQHLCSRLRTIALSRPGPGRPQAQPLQPPGEAAVVKVGSASVRLRGLLLDPAAGTGEPSILIVADSPSADRQPSCDAAYLKQTYNLTQREMEVLEWVRRGASYKEMANALGISPHTIRDHILKMKLKFQADSKCGIMARLIEETCQA